MSEQGSTPTSSSAARVKFLDLCEVDVKSIENVVAGGKLLNRRQCEDLSSRLSQTISNIQELVEYCGASSIVFEPVLRNLYQHVEKAKALVSECARKDWYVVAVFQCENENAFREILLDVGFCYNAIYELAKSTSKDWCNPPEDLRKFYFLLEAASDSDVDGDKQDIQKKLDELVNGHTIFNFLDYITSWIIPGRVARKQRLAHYLLMKMYWKSKEPKARTLKLYTAIMWSKFLEPTGSWGNSSALGHGSGGVVTSTEWLGIPCAKKEFPKLDTEILFLREAGILAHLKHPCIVDFICCGNASEKGDRFICMELMEMSLFNLIEKHRLKGEPFSIGVAMDIMVQMARGVCYLHGEGVAHRDLKPENVVVKRMSSLDQADHYCVKLVDFGSSKGQVEACFSNTMTYRGIGTTLYRAPEVHPDANSNGIGRVKWVKADAYSFAITCAHLLCLQVPFQNTRSSKFYEMIKNGMRPDIPNMYPKDLEQLLKDCWKTSPHLRPSFMEICVRLEKIRYLEYMKSYSTTLNEVSELEKHGFSEGSDFIELKLESSIKPLQNDGDSEEDGDKKDYVSIISCTCGCALQLLAQSPESMSLKETWLCFVCWQVFDGERYCCKACDFDAHIHCAKIKKEVDLYFHYHTLHLLIEDYYIDNPKIKCDVCGEPAQYSKWVYRCEQCDFDVHARCCKFPKKIDPWMLHQHVMIMRQCSHGKSLICTCCNEEVKDNTWYYACSRKECAGYNVHALCTIFSLFPECIFGTSHQLTLVPEDGSFYCAKCGALGVSWSYHCDICDVNIHLDCLDNKNGAKEDKWIKAYKTFMSENESKDHHMKMIMLSKLVNKVPMDIALEGGSSSTTSHLLQGVLPSIQRPTSEEQLISLDSLANDANLRKRIVAQTKERTQAKKAKQTLSTNLLGVLEKLENSFVDLRSSWRNMSEDEAQSLAATQKELTRRQNSVKDRMPMYVQSRMNQGPQIAVFWTRRREEGEWVREILTSLPTDMEGVGWVFLCEEPGHEHVISDRIRTFSKAFGEKRQKLQPMLAGGLDVVMKVLSALEPHELESGLRSVTVPCLEFADDISWDLRAIEVYRNRSMDLCEDAEKVEVMRAQDFAVKWFREEHENYGLSMLKTHGLQRVRYTRTSREDEVSKHKWDNIAWICKDHVNSGLKGGTLELLPLRYYNAQDDHQLRKPKVIFKDEEDEDGNEEEEEHQPF